MATPGSASSAPLGVVLAGGAGRRLGGEKATAELGGRPLVTWARDALAAALAEVVVLAKPDTRLPTLDRTPVWREPAEPRHPLFGLVWALQEAAGRPIVVCAADLPFVPAELVRRIAEPLTGGAAARVAAADGRLQPLLARYEASATTPLQAALATDPHTGVIRAVRGLRPEVVEAPAAALANVNTPEDLARAAAGLSRG